MIVTKTPFRVSFFGGGTDVKDWFAGHGGQVLSTAIDKFCYVTVRRRFRYSDKRIRVSYSRVEDVETCDDIEHPLVRELLKRYMDKDVEVHYDADLPSYSGLGTSSSFAVGLTAALAGMQGRFLSRRELADIAIDVERNQLREAGGYQDQIAAAYGGFNHITFHPDGDYTVNRFPLTSGAISYLNSLMLLCYVPVERQSSDVTFAKDFDHDKVCKQLSSIQSLVDDALATLRDQDIDGFAALLKETWLRKRELQNVSNKTIDAVFDEAMAAGALGGKLLGAGGGGFFLILCPLERQHALRQRLKGLFTMPIKIENSGVVHLYNDSV